MLKWTKSHHLNTLHFLLFLSARLWFPKTPEKKDSPENKENWYCTHIQISLFFCKLLWFFSIHLYQCPPKSYNNSDISRIIIFYLCSSAFNAFTVAVQPWQPNTSGYISGQMKWFISVIKVSYQSWWADMYLELSSWSSECMDSWLTGESWTEPCQASGWSAAAGGQYWGNSSPLHL